ncbi:MAG: polysaccharide biosynthesis/export family protein [Saprospiraceae bacterium]
MFKFNNVIKRNLLLIVVAANLFSCASKKDVVYFQDALNYETIISDNSSDYRFKVDDVVGIHISTLDPEASMAFNLFKGAEEGGIRPEQIDYIIDKDGTIDFPVLGSVKIDGLSPSEVKTLLKEKLSKDYLKNPIINIRLKNFTVTILGEVNRPGTYPVNGEQITIFEALGLAGDLTIKGMRENIKVIRDFNGTKVYNTIDLRTKKALESNVYYLTQNDVIYVEPNKSGVTASSLDNRATIAASLAAALITSAAIFLTRPNQ